MIISLLILSNKFKEMYFAAKESRAEDSNLKLERIRKNILHDVLMYNLETSTNQRNHRKQQQVRQQHMFEVALKQEREAQLREDEQKRLSLIEKRRKLKEEYDRDIEEKKQREQRYKTQNQMYAKLEKEHQVYSNQRRIYDLERIYNRKAYHARIVDTENPRMKTEPTQNPEQDDYPIRRHKREFTQNLIRNDHGHQGEANKEGYRLNGYKDSLDHLQVYDNPINHGKRYNGATVQQGTPNNRYLAGHHEG